MKTILIFLLSLTVAIVLPNPVWAHGGGGGSGGGGGGSSSPGGGGRGGGNARSGRGDGGNSKDTHQQELIRYMTGPVLAADSDLSKEEG